MKVDRWIIIITTTTTKSKGTKIRTKIKATTTLIEITGSTTKIGEEAREISITNTDKILTIAMKTISTTSGGKNKMILHTMARNTMKVIKMETSTKIISVAKNLSHIKMTRKIIRITRKIKISSTQNSRWIVSHPHLSYPAKLTKLTKAFFQHQNSTWLRWNHLHPVSRNNLQIKPNLNQLKWIMRIRRIFSKKLTLKTRTLRMKNELKTRTSEWIGKWMKINIL